MHVQLLLHRQESMPPIGHQHADFTVTFKMSTTRTDFTVTFKMSTTRTDLTVTFKMSITEMNPPLLRIRGYQRFPLKNLDYIRT